MGTNELTYPDATGLEVTEISGAEVRMSAGVLADYLVTYRDWNGEHTFTVQANSYAAADTVVADWKGVNPAIAIVRVVEVFRHDGLTCCAACGQELPRDEEMPRPEDAPGFVEFPAGEFPPQANVGPLA